MSMRDPAHLALVEIAPSEDEEATSDEVFDRLAFAERALAAVKPRIERLAICTASRGGVEVDVGRLWGHGKEARWAIVSVPPRASKRAIALAAAGLAGTAAPPWSLDLLLGAATRDA